MRLLNRLIKLIQEKEKFNQLKKDVVSFLDRAIDCRNSREEEGRVYLNRARKSYNRLLDKGLIHRDFKYFRKVDPEIVKVFNIYYL